MKKKPAQRYDDAWRKQVHDEAVAFIARVKARDEAARARREQLYQSQQEKSL